MDKDLGSDLGPLGGGLGQFWVLTLTSWCREELSSPGLQCWDLGPAKQVVVFCGSGGGESLAVGLVPHHHCTLPAWAIFRGTGERNRGYALLVMANKPETALYRALTFSRLLTLHDGLVPAISNRLELGAYAVTPINPCSCDHVTCRMMS